MSYISFEDVCKDYPAGNTVVHSLSQSNLLQHFTRIKRAFADLLRQFDVLQRRQVRHQIVELKDETHVVAAVFRQLRRAKPGDFLIPNNNPREVLEQVGLGQRMNNFPAQLSGGEQQRVSIARALCKNPALLLCDEPTGALDSKTGEQVLDLLTRLCHDYSTTVVIITHNASIAPLGNRLIRMRNGSVQEMTVNEHPAKVADITW